MTGRRTAGPVFAHISWALERRARLAMTAHAVTLARQPLVAVMTPVYNGADSLSRVSRKRPCANTTKTGSTLVGRQRAAPIGSQADRREVRRTGSARSRCSSFRELLPMLENFNRGARWPCRHSARVLQATARRRHAPSHLSREDGGGRRARHVRRPRRQSLLSGIGTQSTKCSGAGCSTVGTHGCKETLLGTSNVLGRRRFR